MYVPCKFHKFSDIEVTIYGVKVPITNKNFVDLKVGFLPVYDTLEDLYKDYPDKPPYIEIQFKKEDENG